VLWQILDDDVARNFVSTQGVMATHRRGLDV